MMSDKGIEKNRYNYEANKALESNNLFSVNNLSKPLKTPYDFYQQMLSSHIGKNSVILEIGAGMGENTGFLLATGATVYASDISKSSLDVIKKRFNTANPTSKCITKIADMEKLPFANDSFNVVCNAGSLSYGDNDIVMNEIYRVLKPQGVFIAVDSLNNNPIYRLNRYMHYLKGVRSKSTLTRMPTVKLLEKYRQKFGGIKIDYFGSISYLMPLVIKIFGDEKAKNISDKMDVIFNIKRSAFKFTMVTTKK